MSRGDPSHDTVAPADEVGSPMTLVAIALVSLLVGAFYGLARSGHRLHGGSRPSVSPAYSWSRPCWRRHDAAQP